MHTEETNAIHGVIMALKPIGILAIFLIYKGGKKICGKNGYLEKGKNISYRGTLQSFKNLEFGLKKTVEQDKIDLKGHVTENCKGPVRELNAGSLKQLPPFVFQA